MWEPDVGARCGSQMWEPDVGVRCGSQMWESDVGARCGSESSGVENHRKDIRDALLGAYRVSIWRTCEYEYVIFL